MERRMRAASMLGGVLALLAGCGGGMTEPSDDAFLGVDEALPRQDASGGIPDVRHDAQADSAHPDASPTRDGAPVGADAGTADSGIPPCTAPGAIRESSQCLSPTGGVLTCCYPPGSSRNLSCTDARTDWYHCGGCYMQCGGGFACCNGQCVEHACN